MLKKIESISTCKVCKKYYNEPVVLPCGNTICNKHIIDSSTSDGLRLFVVKYKCKFCKLTHYDHQLTGFTKNIIVEDLIKLVNENQKKYFNPSILGSSNDSIILAYDNLNATKNLLTLCEFEEKTNLKLVCRGSHKNFNVSDFHLQCDRLRNLLFLVKSGDCIFGAFSSETWDNNNLKMDPNSFLFSYKNREEKPVKLKPRIGSIWSNKDLVCQFGMDLTIGPDQNSGFLVGKSDLGHSYLHNEYAYQSSKAQSFLGGSFKFTIDYIEIYLVDSTSLQSNEINIAIKNPTFTETNSHNFLFNSSAYSYKDKISSVPNQLSNFHNNEILNLNRNETNISSISDSPESSFNDSACSNNYNHDKFESLGHGRFIKKDENDIERLCSLLDGMQTNKKKNKTEKNLFSRIFKPV